MKGQSTPDMPIVEVRSLEENPGDTVSVDLFNIIGGKPTMGDRKIEGKGDALTYSSMDVRCNQARKAVSAGGEMSRKRTVNNLRGVAMAALLSYFPRLRDQLCLVHLAGARGSRPASTGPCRSRPTRTSPTSGEHGEGADLQPALRVRRLDAWCRAASSWAPSTRRTSSSWSASTRSVSTSTTWSIRSSR
jgi:N4-gp56 family major capsid protein